MANFAPIYADDMPLADKVQTICKQIYRADEAVMDKKILDQLKDWEAQGYGHLPVCMAKPNIVSRPIPISVERQLAM